MVFDLKAVSIIGAVTLASIISPAFHSLRRQCFAMNQSVLLTKALSTSEPILKCKENNGNRDYSVFLVFANGSGSTNSRTVRLKVVDNKDKTTKWEKPNGGNSNIWNDWAIEIYQDKNDSFKEKVLIKVPIKRTFNRPWERVSIPCQTSQLKLKKDTRSSKCAGGYLRGTQMQLVLLLANNIVLSPEFDWKEEFKTKPVFCTS